MKKPLLLVILIIATLSVSAQSFWQDLYYEPGFDLGHYTPFSANNKYIAN